MRRLDRVVFAWLVLVTSCAPVDDAIEICQRAIIQGEACAAEVHPSAVAVVTRITYAIGDEPPETLAAFVCSGVAVARDAVLSAAHCFDPTRIAAPPLEVIEARYWVTREGDLSEWVDGVATALPDDAVEIRPYASATDADLALAVTVAPLDIATATVATADEAALLAPGAGVEVVGWGAGQSPTLESLFTPTGAGTRRCAASFVQSLDAARMQIGRCGARKCFGDSGGPTYVVLETPRGVVERLVGVAARGNGDGRCARGGIDTRLDAHRDWLDATLRDACDDGARIECVRPGLVVEASSGARLVHSGVSDPEDLVCADDSPVVITVDAPSPEVPRGPAVRGGCQDVGGDTFAWWCLLPLLARFRRRRSQHVQVLDGYDARAVLRDANANRQGQVTASLFERPDRDVEEEVIRRFIDPIEVDQLPHIGRGQRGRPPVGGERSS